MSFKKAPSKRNNTAGKAIKQPEERRTPQQKQSNKTQIIETSPSGRNPEDLVESFTEMFPDYKSLTKEEIISIFRDYNNDFQAVVNSVMDKTIGIQPSESWTDVPKKKKKKQNQEPPRSGDSQRGGQQRNRDFNRRRPPGAQQKNRPGQAPASSATAATVPQQVTPPANPAVSLQPSAQPSQAPTPVVQTKEVFTPHTPPASTPEPFTNTPPVTTTPVTTPSSNFARSTISYANAAKSRQPWSPHTQSTTQAALNPVEEEPKKVAEPKEEPKQVEVPQAVQSSKPAEPVVERPAVKPVSVSVPKQPTPPREPVAPKSAPVEVKQPLVVSAPVVPKPTPVEHKQRAGVVLPGSFAEEAGGMQFQFGNLGIYDEEVESTPEAPINIPAPVNVNKPAPTNLSNPSTKPTPAPAPAPVSAQDYPENLSHVSSEAENMIPHLPYAPNQFMPYPFDADSSRPVGHYYEAQAYPTAFSRDGKAYPGGRQTGNQNFGGRDTKYSGQEPGAANTQATAQTPSAPNQGYPYHSMYPYGPFMGQFPSYSTSQFHYQPAPMGYYPAKRAYPSFGSYPSNTGMGYPEDEYKGAYSSIPQQPGSYYMQPGDAANPGLNRDSKSQSTGQSNTSKPGQSGNQQSSKPSSQTYSNAPSQDQGAPNPSGTNSFKASGNSNSDAYYPRDTQYGIGNTSFMSQGFYPHPQIVAQTQPNTTPYQPNRGNY